MKARTPMKYLLGLVIIAALVAGAAGLQVKQAADEEPTAGATAQTEASADEEGVSISVDAQRRSGIAVAALTTAARQSVRAAHGTVLDLQPLLDLQMRAATARADAETAKAALQASKAEFDRVRRLHGDDGNMSLKAVQTAQAAYRSDQAKSDLASAVLKNVQASAVSQFGPVLARWALDPESGAFQPFANREAAIVRVALPSTGKSSAPSTIQLAAEGFPSMEASLIGTAAQADPSIPGRAYLYRTASALPANAHLLASVPLAGAKDKGMLIPESAVVWYGGQPWAFVRVEEDRFERRAIPVQHAMSDAGYIVHDGFEKEDQVVVTGAQLLLSEEFRASIQSEDGDD